MIVVAALACLALQVEAVSPGGPSTLLSVELPSGAATTVSVLDHRLNALGYSAEQGVYYGVSPDGRVVEVDRQGRTTDVGHVPHPGLVHAVAGAIHGDHFYVRSGGALYVVDVNPASTGFLELVRARVLWPIDVFLSIDDFDYNPSDGLLYGVATRTHGHPEVVTIDPDSGRVEPLTNRVRLPDGSGYGATVLGPDGALYATNNNEGGRSTLYRVALDGSGEVTRLSERPAARTIDAAGCVAVPPPTTPPASTTPAPTTSAPTTPAPTTPAPTTSPPVRTTAAPSSPTTVPGAVVPPSPTTTTTADPVVPAAVVPVPPPVTTATTPASTAPRPTPRPVFEVDRPVEEVVALSDRRTDSKRRWSLAVLLLVIGAGAVAAQQGRRA
ncbi:DUF6923 family protein [Umezawaea sp.]|uniref:DUF6923 family protein n=1 Tax=Umezawaea sp. TaxID=1955258 RepID=UPI002ED482DF